MENDPQLPGIVAQPLTSAPTPVVSITGPVQLSNVVQTTMPIQTTTPHNMPVSKLRDAVWLDAVFIYLSFILISLLISLSQRFFPTVIPHQSIEEAQLSNSFPIWYFLPILVGGAVISVVSIVLTFFLVKFIIRKRTRGGKFDAVSFILLLISVGFSIYLFGAGAASLFSETYSTLAPLGIILAFIFYAPVFFIANVFSMKYVSKRIYQSDDDSITNGYSIVNKTLLLSRRIVYVGMLLVPILFVHSSL